jgi:DNA excision repair protein ERCC-1
MSDLELLAAAAEVGPKPKPGPAKVSGCIQVSARQRGNPLLRHLRAAPWEFVEELVPDYLVTPGCAVLYLSVRYHTLQPAYIGGRLDKLGLGHRLRVLLVQVDVKDPHHVLNQLMRLAILSELTLMLAWSPEEAAKIIETYKTFEHKPPDLIMEKGGTEPHEKLIEALTSVKSVNKTDAVTLLGTFRTMEAIVRASPEDLALCPGFGPNKAKKLHKVLHERFLRAEKPMEENLPPEDDDVDL